MSAESRIGYWLLAALVVGAPALRAEQQDTPSAEFLEFLGSWESKDGQWVDPFELLEPEQDGRARSKQEDSGNE